MRKKLCKSLAPWELLHKLGEYKSAIAQKRGLYQNQLLQNIVDSFTKNTSPDNGF